MNLSKITYNDLAFMSFGEAMAVRREIEKLVDELDETAAHLAEHEYLREDYGE